jgi:DNA-binding CsgD family transcriptional regulator
MLKRIAMRSKRRKSKAATPKRLLLPLTPRQTQVLKLLTQGKTMKQAARQLRLRLTTVMTHVRRGYEKLGARNRASAILQFAKVERGEGNGRTNAGLNLSVDGVERFRFCPACGCNFEDTVRQPIFAIRENDR